MFEPNNVFFILRAEKNKQLNALYAKYRNENVNLFNQSELKEMVKEICKGLEIRSEFKAEILGSFKGHFKEIFRLKTFDEFCKTVFAWMNTNKLEYIPVMKTKELYKERLGMTRIYYQKYLKNCKEEDKKILESSIMMINSKLNLLNKVHYYELPLVSVRQDLFVREIEVLQEIFNFYASSSIVISKHTTFDGLQAQKKVWTCGIFIKFLTVFGIYKKSLNKNYSISHKAILDLFTKHSLFKKSLTFSGLLSILADISLEFYRNPGNSLFVIDYSNLNPFLCRTALLDKIRILSISNIKKTLKASVKSFSNGDCQSRIAVDDPCFKYKFTLDPIIYDKLKQIKIEKARNRKKKMAHSSASSEVHLRIRTRPASNYFSSKHSRKTSDVIKFADYSKSRASFECENFIE